MEGREPAHLEHRSRSRAKSLLLTEWGMLQKGCTVEVVLKVFTEGALGGKEGGSWRGKSRQPTVDDADNSGGDSKNSKNSLFLAYVQKQ